MQRRTAIVLAFAACSIFPSFLAGSDELNQRLKRIFDSNAFAGKRFGPARWIRGGAAFITLENAPSTAARKTARKTSSSTIPPPVSARSWSRMRN